MVASLPTTWTRHEGVTVIDRTSPGPRLSREIAVAFCDQCNWAYEVWVTHKSLFDDNPNRDANISRAHDFIVRLSRITHEYALQQVSKLHDRGEQRGHLNLSIDYVVRFGEWGDKQEQIDAIRTRLEQLHEYIRPARDKILSHNDLETVVGNHTLGDFPKGIDVQYFKALQDLANEVHLRWTGKLYPFYDLAISDVHAFLHLLELAPLRGRRSPPPASRGH